MCMPYFNKLFGGGHRRRNRARNGGITPGTSVPNVNQVSIPTVKIAKVGGGKQKGKVVGKETPNPMAPSTSIVQGRAPAAGPTSPGGERSGTRSTWWDYFGMNKKK
ncbi:hypothetical protein KR009_005821 [Drosophila setifemur]|nr:hypothetical protein KR009_005821 [Drosophila setifemur]